MLVSVLITAMIMVYLYATLNNVKQRHENTKRYTDRIVQSEQLFSLMMRDFTQRRSPLEIFHDPSFDRTSLFCDNSLYSIAKPWVFYYVSDKERALVRVESTSEIDFTQFGSAADQKMPYFFADVLATECESFRVSTNGERLDVMLRCQSTEPIVLSLFQGVEE